MNSSRRTFLYGATQRRDEEAIGSFHRAPRPRASTNALGTSPATSSGEGMTATSATAGSRSTLQFGRGHLVALVLDQLLEAVDDEEVAVVVSETRSAGAAAAPPA